MGNMNVTVIDQNNVNISVTPTPNQVIAINRGLIGPTGASGYSGYSGYSGQGSSGFSGISGYSGFSGQSGYSGISGYSGSGVSGYSGFSGYSGEVGTSGYSGISGYSGFSGSGISGFSGDSGISGYSGFSGYSGQQGTSINVKGEVPTVGDLPPTGNQVNDAYIVTADGNLWVWNGSAWYDAGQIVGPSGASGISGFSGYSGDSGISGFSGASGISGWSGISGTNGQSGYSGISGWSGISGYSGSGVSGYSGYSGYSGIGTSGYSGISGYSGYSGAAGLGGAVGAYGSFYDTTTQTTSANTPTAINLNTTDGSNNVVLISANQWQFNVAGTFSITYSLQFTNTSTANGSTQVWLRKNGSDLADSNTHYDVPDKQGSAFSTEVLTVNYVLNVSANDVFQLYWQTANTSVAIETLAATGSYPRTPSVILTATQVMYTQSGYSGTSGYSGFSGISGTNGASGLSGYSGYSGLGVSLPVSIANGGTGATVANGAMANLMGFTSTATAAGTTTLTNTSSYYQLFTGATTQTIVLPVTSTLQTGWTFHICNNSSGTLTVNSSGGNLVISVVAGLTVMCTCIGTTLTTAADWEAGFTDFSTLTGTGAVVLGTSPTISSPSMSSPSATGSLNFTGTSSSTANFASSVTTGTTNICTSQTSGTLTIGGTSGTGTQTIGQSTVSQTTNIQAGATASGSTKTVNIGTGGLAGSTTNIAIGSTTGTSTTTLNGTVTGTISTATSANGVAAGVVSGKMIYQSFTATASQTTFTPTISYVASKIEVFANGVKMVNGSDVTVTSGTSVVFATGLAVGTLVDVVYPT